jgi:hypothetical protein
VSVTGSSAYGEGAPPQRVTSAVDLALAAVGIALGLAAMAVDHLLGDDPGLEDPPAFAISALIVLAVAGLLFGRVVPRARDPRRAGFIVALLGVASLPLIWLGVPFAVAPAAIALGRKGDGRLSTAAVAIGVVVLLLVTAAYTYDAVDKLS